MTTIMKVSIRLYVHLLVTLLIMDVCNATSNKAKHMGAVDNSKHRSRRQTGDIVLIGLKAKSALKGTTRPSEFFRRIGKKRSHVSGPSSYSRLSEGFQPYTEYDDELFAV